MITKPSKRYVLDYIAKLAERNPNLSILDIGSGESLNFIELLGRFPTIQYTGLEPNKSEHEKAKKHLAGQENVTLVHALGYDTNILGGKTFDLVVSLSVLEHIKHKNAFVKFSAACAKPGGEIIHLYDLGHALHPKSFKERIHVLLGNNTFTWRFLPETKFVSYCDSDMIVRMLKENGASVSRITNHSMGSHVALLKVYDPTDIDVREIVEMEMKFAVKVSDKKKREKLFPSVCIWASKV